MTPWDGLVNSLADRMFAGSKRRKEIDAEIESEYDQWASELRSEILVFVKRVKALDLEESNDRHRFYEFVKRFSERLRDLRERSEASNASAEALIRLEELIEELNESSSKVHVSVALFGGDPFKKARWEKRKKERYRERIEQARKKMDNIADQIQELISAFDVFS